MPPSYPPVEPEAGFTFAKRRHDTYPEIDSATMSDCSGMTVLVTGASRGIGLATAMSYAAAGVRQLALGARSDLDKASRDIKLHCERLGKPVPTLLALSLDVQDQTSVDAAAQRVTQEFGRLDILVNNAGYIDTFVPIADSDPLSWWKQYEVNVLGLYLCTRAFLPILLHTEDGNKTIINTTSIGAHTLMEGASSYQTAKLAVVRFSEFIMHEYAGQGILCYSIHPGGVATEMTNCMTEDFKKNLLNDTVELPADALVFLTQIRREWLAGRYVDLSWDMPELLSREEEIVRGDKLKVKLVV